MNPRLDYQKYEIKDNDLTGCVELEEFCLLSREEILQREIEEYVYSAIETQTDSIVYRYHMLFSAALVQMQGSTMEHDKVFNSGTILLLLDMFLRIMYISYKSISIVQIKNELDEDIINYEIDLNDFEQTGEQYQITYST